MERIFHLKENGTTVKTEILAGLTTFMTMAYIIALNPNLLTGFQTGTPLWNGVFLATCIASAIGTVCMAFLANKPFVMAPGMGLNSFFAVVAGNVAALLNTDYTSAFQAVLCIILVEGIVFLLLSVFNIRDKIVHAIPLGVRLGIGPAIGLMLMNIGVGSNVGVYAEGNGYTDPFYVMRDFFGAMTPSVIKDHMGAEYSTMVLTVITMFVGLFVIILLAKKGIKAAVLVGMLASSVIYWAGEAIFLHVNPFASLQGASFVPPFHDMAATTLFKFDFTDFFRIGWFTAITLVITFCMIDMFDTIGTLYGTASQANMLDKNGDPINVNQCMTSDSVATVAGAVCGTSTCTTFVESAAGVGAGGRTGLTSLVVAICFAVCLFLSPVASLVPTCATAPALIYVGVLMINCVKDLDWMDPSVALPSFLTMAMMPFTYNISYGIAFGLISYVLIRIFTGKIREVKVGTWVITILFLLMLFLTH